MLGPLLPQTRFSALRVDGEHLNTIRGQNPDLGHAMAQEMIQRQHGQESVNTGIRLLEQAGVDVVVRVADGYCSSPRQLEIDLERQGSPLKYSREDLDRVLQEKPLLEGATWGDVVHWALLKHLNILNLTAAKKGAIEPA